MASEHQSGPTVTPLAAAGKRLNGEPLDSRLSLLTEAVRAIDLELPPDELLRQLADAARHVIGAHQAVISLTSEEHGAGSISGVSLSDKYAAWRGYDERPDGGGIYSLVVRSGESMRLTQDELEAHPAYKRFGESADRHPPLRGWLAAPLLDRDGRSTGLIQLSDKYEGEFTSEDEALATHLAQIAVIGVETARGRQEAVESSVLLDAIQFAAPVGFALFDEDLRYVRVNEALAEMSGVPTDDFPGRTIRDHAPELADQVEPRLRAVLETGEPAEPTELGGPTPVPGGERHWLMTAYPVDVPGRRGVGAVVIDVTERRLATERLRRSEERYRSIAETTQDLIWTVDKDGRFEFVSGAVERMYGYTAEELIGKSFLDFVPPDRRPTDSGRFARAMSGVGAEGEARLLRKDGTVRIVEYRSFPLTDENGNVVALTGTSTDVTERRRSEAALRASQDRFRSLFEDAVVGMALIDGDGRFLQVNPAFCRVVGRPADELATLNWLDVVHPEDRAVASARRDRQLGGESEPRPLETRLLHRDGHPVWTRLMSASVRAGEGERRHTLVQAIDLTEQRRLEEATTRVYALTRDIICTLDYDGRFQSVNPAWERVLGYAPGDLLARTFLDFVDPEDRARTAREFDRLRLAGDLTLSFENRYVHKDGSRRWLLWSAYVSPEERLVHAVAKDVTDRKRSEERLRESERKYRDLVETSSDIIWSVDTGGCFTFINRAAKRIYGYEPEEMLGRPIGDFESHEQRLRDEEAFRRVLTGTPLFNYHTRHVRKDGRQIDLSVNAIVLHDENGAVLGATGTATDVTDRKRSEARQAAVAELGRRALEGVGLAEITDAAVALVGETLVVEYAEVLELLPGGEELQLHAAVGWPKESLGTHFPANAEASHAAYSIQLDGPVVVEDFAAERRFERPAKLGAIQARSGVCVTIEGEARPFGVLCAHSTRRRSFSADEVNFLQAVANVLATAIGRKRTEERIVELAAARGRLVAQALAAEDRARRSISEVLHDHALQDLLASRQDLVEVIEEPGGDPERVVRAREGIERAVQLLRDAVFNLHPVVLEHAGLASAIRAVADHQGRRGGFECSIEVEPEATAVHDELVLSLARELLTNVAKHAEAKHARAEVRRQDSWIELLVEDDGRGIQPGRREAALREGHVGLASIAERVEALAGRFTIARLPGGGTSARALLPARRGSGERVDRRRLPGVSGRRPDDGR